MMKFYDRKEELALILESEKQSRETATMMVVNGRRRVGKTSLVTKALEGMDTAYLFLSKDTEAVLCCKLKQELETSLGITVYGQLATFRSLFEVIMQESQKRHFTVILDELQNLNKANPAAFSDMQDLWDRYKDKSHLTLICCGSVRTMMKKIFEDKGEPLYGRSTSKFSLRPFTISTIKEILSDYNPDFSSEDLLTLYMITGGVAKYVELLMDAKCTTHKKMMDYVFRADSYFLTEGKDMLTEEFSSDYGTYFSIMQLVASGLTRVSEIDGVMQKPSSVYLSNLEKSFGMITKCQPLLAKSGSKVSKYLIKDPFLRFWFRFVYPYQALIERQQFQLIRKNAEDHYAQFSGKTLETYFQEKAYETGQYSLVGNWWDREGENEIDYIALNEFDHTGVIAEIKRNPRKISLSALKDKVAVLPHQNFGKYHFSFTGFSMEDM